VETIELKASPRRMLGLAGVALLMGAMSLGVRWIDAHGELRGPLAALGPTGIAVVAWLGLALSAGGVAYAA
jgi:hypothetical protein